MQIDRTVTFTLTLDLDDLRMFRNALLERHRVLRSRSGVRELSDEQVAAVRGDRPVSECRKAAEYHDRLNDLITEEMNRRP